MSQHHRDGRGREFRGFPGFPRRPPVRRGRTVWLDRRARRARRRRATPVPRPALARQGISAKRILYRRLTWRFWLWFSSRVCPDWRAKSILAGSEERRVGKEG